MAVLTSKREGDLPDSAFAAVWTDAKGQKQRKLPIYDKEHADNAAARVNQTEMPAKLKAIAAKKIADAQKRFGEKAPEGDGAKK